MIENAFQKTIVTVFRRITHEPRSLVSGFQLPTSAKRAGAIPLGVILSRRKHGVRNHFEGVRKCVALHRFVAPPVATNFRCTEKRRYSAWSFKPRICGESVFWPCPDSLQPGIRRVETPAVSASFLLV